MEVNTEKTQWTRSNLREPQICCLSHRFGASKSSGSLSYLTEFDCHHVTQQITTKHKVADQSN